MNEYVNYETAPQVSEFGKFLGIEVTRFDRKEHVVEIDWNLTTAHYSRAGKAHGGAIAGVFDALCGLATFTELENGDVCSTIEIKINFLTPLESGKPVKGIGRVVHCGKRTCVVQAEIYSGAETNRVAIATGTFNIVRAAKAL